MAPISAGLTLLGFLAFTLPAGAAGAVHDPVGFVEIPADQTVRLYKSPTDARPIKTLRLDSQPWATYPVVGYRGEGVHEEALLVWSFQEVQGHSRYQVQARDGFPWLEPVEDVHYKSFEEELLKDDFVVIDARHWNQKLYDSPGSKTFKVFDSSPDLSYLELPAPTCRDTGTVKDRTGAEWTQSSCDAGRKIPLFSTPGGKRLVLKNPNETTFELDVAETSVDVVMMAYAPRGGSEVGKRIFVFDQRDGYIKVRLHKYPPYNGHWAWMKADAGTLKEFSSPQEMSEGIEMVRDMKQFLTEDMGAQLDSAPNSYSAEPKKIVQRGGTTWVEVGIYSQDLCTSPVDVTPEMTGWVTLMATTWDTRFSVTTCD